MTETDRRISFDFARRRQPSGLMSSLLWLGGLVATLTAMAVGAVLAIFTAVAVALIALVGGIVVFFAGLALRARRTVSPHNRRADDVIEARKVDGAWVTYGWERTGGN
ncbi:MAG: hypothetical protein HZY74_11530 [Brevundimonas sp.]|nr:MAG: hypothetical protein HZY74_11530 [Brevundimonas sp.]